MLYRAQAAAKSVLVGSSALLGIVCEDDAVIAVTWADWPPKAVVASIVAAAVKLAGVLA